MNEMNIIEKLEWRYAVKAFDADKAVPDRSVEQLIEIVRLSPSSRGLQPYKIAVIYDKNTKSALAKASISSNTRKIEQASHLIVFAIRASLDKETIDRQISLAAEISKRSRESLQGYQTGIEKFIGENTQEQLRVWSTHQAYLAVGNLLTACALMDIDTCPMEGIDSAAYDKVLTLTTEGLMTVVAVAIGYRDSDDLYSKYEKVRKPTNEILIKF